MHSHEIMVIKDYEISKLKAKWPKIGISLKIGKTGFCQKIGKIGMLDALHWINFIYQNVKRAEVLMDLVFHK